MDIRINSVQINFKISKINGKDVQSKSSADILDIFKLSRNQTMLVEMIPKALNRDESKNSIKSVDSQDSINLRKENISTVSTQTEWTLSQDNWSTNTFDQPKSDVNLKCPLSSSRSDHSVNLFGSSLPTQCNGNNSSGGHISSMLMNHHQHFQLPSYLYHQGNGLTSMNDDAQQHDYEIIEEDSEDEDEIDDDEDDILECDAIQYEEVTLVRRSSENLGFTLSSSYSQLTRKDNPMVQSNKTSHPDRGDVNLPTETNNKLSPTSSSSPSLSLTSDQHQHHHDVQPKVDVKKNEMIGEVYISSLNANSPAALDGRIKIGDQILEINDMEIKNIDEAQSILDRKDINTFELLIGRLNPAHDHDKCRQLSLYRRLSLYESLETEPNLQSDSDYLSQLQQHHVSIVDCSQEFYMLSLKNGNSDGCSSNTHQMNSTKESINSTCENGSTSKDERDSGMGKTDGDSSEGKTNDTYSIDNHHHELSFNGSHHREVKVSGKNFTPETVSSSIKPNSGEEDILEQKRKILQEEMTNIQLQCESLSQQFEDELNKSEANKINGQSLRQQQQQLPQPEEQEEAIYDEPIFVQDDSKVAAFSSKNKPKIPQKPSFSSSSSSSSKDYLPEIQQQDKKESIKRWIRSGLPTTPPSITTVKPSQSIFCHGTNEWKEQITCTDHNPNQVGVGKDFITIQIPQPSIVSIPSNYNSNNNNGFRGNGGLVSSFISPPKKATINEDKSTNSNNNKRKDVAVATEERLTQIESDSVSLTSCESCRLCSNPHILDGPRRPDRVNPVNPENRHSAFQVQPCDMPVNHIVEPDITYRGKSSSSMVKSEINHHHQSLPSQCANTVVNPSGPIVAGPMSSYPTTTTMYTTEANLEHTIQIQQQLFRQALLAQQKGKPWKQRTDRMSMDVKSNHPSASDHLITSSSSTSSPSSQHNSNMNTDNGQFNNGPPMTSVRREILTHQLKYQQLQSPGDCSNSDSISGWKIKRRPDGTHYITRKVSRSKILRDRAEKINQERSGMTTDDDAMSEMKIGRYWTRDERKKHLEKAKDRKRKELLHRANKMSALREQSEERDHSQKLIKGGSGQDSGSMNNQHSSGSSGSMARSRSKHNGCSTDAHCPVSSNGKIQTILPNSQPASKSRSSGVLSVTTV